jgi:hypothetical protein
MTNLLSGLASPAPQPSSAHDSPLQNRASERGRSEPDASLGAATGIASRMRNIFGDPLVRLARTPACIKPPSSPFVIDELWPDGAMLSGHCEFRGRSLAAG